jgi:hypothetical protein
MWRGCESAGRTFFFCLYILWPAALPVGLPRSQRLPLCLGFSLLLLLHSHTFLLLLLAQFPVLMMRQVSATCDALHSAPCTRRHTDAYALLSLFFHSVNYLSAALHIHFSIVSFCSRVFLAKLEYCGV